METESRQLYKGVHLILQQDQQGKKMHQSLESPGKSSLQVGLRIDGIELILCSSNKMLQYVCCDFARDSPLEIESSRFLLADWSHRNFLPVQPGMIIKVLGSWEESRYLPSITLFAQSRQGGLSDRGIQDSRILQ